MFYEDNYEHVTIKRQGFDKGSCKEWLNIGMKETGVGLRAWILRLKVWRLSMIIDCV